MTDTTTVKASFERIVQAMTQQPSIARGTIEAKAVYKSGLSCDVESGNWKMSADMPKKGGGDETGPAPGQYMMMALGSCQAITIALWAARYNVPVEQLEVLVQVQKDSRGLYGVDDQPSRWKAIKYSVYIQSPASEEEVQKVLDAAHMHSPMRDNLEHAFTIEKEVHITSPAT